MIVSFGCRVFCVYKQYPAGGASIIMHSSSPCNVFDTPRYVNVRVALSLMNRLSLVKAGPSWSFCDLLIWHSSFMLSLSVCAWSEM
jgi:hypothetical protein